MMENISNNPQNNPAKIVGLIKRPVALWLVAVLVVIGFGGGTLIGSRLSPAAEKIIIKGSVAAASTTFDNSGNIINAPLNTTGTAKVEALPAYLKKDVNFNLYWDTWKAVKDKSYNKDIPDTKLFYGSLEGIVASLSDPYSVFMTPSDATQFQDDLKGSFEGIGAEIAVKNNQLIIVSPLDDSPAMKAGLRPKDWILKINGTSTDGLSSSEAVSLIRGQAGTKVILTIYRDGFSAAQDFTITRAAITVKSLTLEYLNNGAIAHVKVRQFNEDTVPLFDSAINNILSKSKTSIRGIILDLRGNPGGYLESAVQIAGEWDGQSTVVSEKDRNGVTTDHQAFRNSRLAGYKTIVLVDGGSASASEIVAGALKDWGKATIVGMKTFGKGSVQDLTQLSDGSQIKLTIAKWFTPKGVSIDEQGIEPDVKVDLTVDDYNKDKDPQLDKAVELLK